MLLDVGQHEFSFVLGDCSQCGVLTLTPAISQYKSNCLLSLPSSFAIANTRKFKPDFQSSTSQFDADI